MRAQEITFLQLVQGEKQFQIPLYQRTYSWQEPQLRRLWEDILEQVEAFGDGEQPRGHFLGSVVLAPGVITAGGMSRWLVVDGQQRLTTLMLACCALRDHWAAREPREAERIDKQVLTNEYASGNDRYRLLPTQADRPAYTACVDRDVRAGGADNIGTAYNFFRAALVEADRDGEASLRRIEQVIRGHLSIVEITAESGDNVYRIFESINNTGLGLSQTDLLRNYLFMLLPKKGDDVYRRLWLPMQQRLGPDNLELLVWLDLIVRGHEKAKQSDIYRAQQQRLDAVNREGGEEALEAEIAELAQRSLLLERIVDPSMEQDTRLREALERLRAWGGQTAYPLMFHLLDVLDRKATTPEEVAEAFGYVESFLVRRMICGIATNNLNRIFMSAPKELEQDRPVAEAVRR